MRWPLELNERCMGGNSCDVERDFFAGVWGVGMGGGGSQPSHPLSSCHLLFRLQIGQQFIP